MNRVNAIRDHALVGRGSCSAVDECMTDDELRRALDDANVDTPEAAIKWALEDEQLFLEKGLDCRQGEDDDPQLREYEDFVSRRADGKM